MFDLALSFIISQVLEIIAMVFNFLSFQYKKRESTLLCLIASYTLIGMHYFLLNKITAGIILFLAVARLFTSYFTTNNKYMYFFLFLSISSLFFTYYNIFDIIPVIASCIMVIGVFQKNNKLMREIMMIGTSVFIVYNIIIFSPMAVLEEGIFLSSNVLGYYRHFIRKSSKLSKRTGGII